MRKIMFFSGLVLMTCLSQAEDLYDPQGAIISRDGQFLVIEKGQPASAQEISFIYYKEGFGAVHFYEIDNSEFDDVYIIKDTIRFLDPLVKETLASFGKVLSVDAYNIWKSGQKKVFRKIYRGGYNSWLTLNTVRTVETAIYYDRAAHAMKADWTEKSKTRFPWENIALFIALFFAGLKTRNVFRNCGQVSLALVAMIYTSIGIIFLLPWIVPGTQNSVSITLMVAFFSLFVMIVNHNYPFIVILSDKKNKKSTRLKFVVVIGMSLLLGVSLWINLDCYQFLLLSLSAGLLAYFFPFWKGKRDSKRKFVIPSSEKLEA